MYSKKCIKFMWRYYSKNYSYRNIANLTKRQFLLDSSIDQIQKDISIMFPTRTRSGNLSGREINYLLYMHSNFEDTEKLVYYINTRKKVSMTITLLTLQRLSSKYKIRKKYRKINSNSFTDKATHKEIVEKYLNGKNTRHLSEEYGYKTEKSISDILKKYNVGIRHGSDSYIINPYSFEKIDSDFKAYYLGILLTDGYINKNRNNVSVQMKDKDVIEFIAENTNSKCIDLKCGMYKTSIYHSKYKQELIRLGIVEKKSLTLKGPTLYPEETKYLSYIMRGIIDGDGWIRKDGKEFFICSASESFIKWCETSLKHLGMINVNLRFVSNDFSGIYYLRTSRKENMEILKSIIYKYPFGMNRKFNRLHNINNNVQRL